MKENKYTIHTLFLAAMSVFGSFIITLPFLNAKNPYLSLVVCASLAVTVVSFSIPIIKRARGTAFYLVGFAIVLVSLYSAVDTILEYITFLSSLGYSRVLSSVLLIILLTSLTISSDTAFLKCALLFGVITAMISFLVFVMPINEYDLSNAVAIPLKLEPYSTFKLILKSAFPLLSAVSLGVFGRQGTRQSAVVFGGAVGFGLVFIALLQSVLMLGDTAQCYSYPYLKAVSAYSTGQLYIRQDGFVWFVFFAATLIKASVCTRSIRIILKKKEAV